MKEILPDASMLDRTLLAGTQEGTVTFRMGKSILGKYGGDSWPTLANVVLYLPPAG